MDLFSKIKQVQFKIARLGSEASTKIMPIYIRYIFIIAGFYHELLEQKVRKVKSISGIGE
jgi:hypothetical protein